VKKAMQKVMDGNTAAAYISYAFTEVASIYPITPSSPMAEMIDEWSVEGVKNIFGAPVTLREMQSEGGAAGAMHGVLQGGALASTYTASQGLLLMIPNIYKITGELLPGVFHISARSLASNALSIFGDHQDVMAIRQTGISLLASGSVQECMDLGAVAHLSAIKSRIPVAHFFDGFRTSHEYQKIDALDYEDMKAIVDWKAIQAFRDNALNPAHPVLRGTTQNPDTFFQTREAVNPFYTNLAGLIQSQMDLINKLTGRDYRLFNYYGPAKPRKLIISMGSSCEVIKEALDYKGGDAGLLQVRLFRPFAADRLLEAIPDTVELVTVLDRTKEPGAAGEPLYTEVRNACFGRKNPPRVIGGRYGLASKDFTPRDVFAVLENMDAPSPRDGFTVGINDDVTHLSLPPSRDASDTAPAGTTACKFWGFGSDGTVSANKSAVKIIGENTDMYTQAYFVYDAKKSGGITVSHVRFGKSPIRSSYLVTSADFIACHNQTYVTLYDLLEGIKEGGTFLLNCNWPAAEVHKRLPKKMVQEIIDKKVNFYIINAVDIAREIGLGGRINMVMQAAFFALVKALPAAEAARFLKEEAEASYGRAGQKVVDLNCQAIDRGFSSIEKVTLSAASVKEALDEAPEEPGLPGYVTRVQKIINAQKGDILPVSVFKGVEDGTFPTGTTKYEKRGVALEVPVWDAEKCIQCNRCSFVCPHSVLRPTLLTEAQVKAAPATLPHKQAVGLGDEGKALEFTMGLSALDCQGCGNCVQVCPAKEKALVMGDRASRDAAFAANWAYIESLPWKRPIAVKADTVKGSQFLPPYFEFPCSCAGCGETPYARLITGLFGSRMMISNSAGCATVWGGNTPSVPYCKDDRGRGPAWDFSLFEDNAEFGFGMSIGARTVRSLAAAKLREALPAIKDGALAEAAKDFLDNFDLSEGTWERADALAAAITPYRDDPLLGQVYRLKDYYAKRSFWVFGGDGWAYDIGYGGLDHVLASGENINVMVFDTEVYSNTGGQSSKATPAGATAKFAMGGKETAKKDLGRLAMTYGSVYVAQVAMGASLEQCLKAVIEAEAYPGPSLIIGYAPCINHGIKTGMGTTQAQQKRAVDCGYWSLWRYNPALKVQGKNPFTLDSKEPAADFNEFLMSEVRYSALMKSNPAAAERLFAKTKQDAMDRLAAYQNLSKM
jgi:pyruvate-ferredoxin/flavodoxin oxidoreductase